MPNVEGATLADWVEDARRRTLDLVADLADEQMLGPMLDIVNPPLWEIGHVAYFQEWWVLRHALAEAPSLSEGDALYDSAKVAHDTRWNLPLPSRKRTLAYLGDVRDRVLERLGSREIDERLRYFVLLSIFHEDMHGEALLYTRQTLAYAAPRLGGAGECTGGAPVELGDARVAGGVFELGASPDAGFVFDNEKWSHPVDVAPFSIARAAVTQGEFARFVEDSGYGRRALWTDEGWTWRVRAGAELPAYWRHAGSGFERRLFDRWVPLEPSLAMIHVSAFEAEAYCRWAGRRLPTEAEWELAAAAEPEDPGGRQARRKRRHPWGDEAPSPERANLDARLLGQAPVAASAAGESAHGCRQMTGNVWEWTSTAFRPYPGFVRDPYAEYSEPWFGDHRVLRGGCFATRARLIRNTWRNFYRPERRDVWGGFRTCALD